MLTLDQLDMLDGLDPLERIDKKLQRAMRRLDPGGGGEPPKYPALPPAEHQAAVDSLLGKTMGGLQYVGETLDKPGRAVRGLLAGRPGELANLIPFSDAMGITDPSKAVSGRDLLEKAGALDANKEGLDAGDAAGFAAEVALDPLTYLTFGASALSKAGKAAKAAGTLEKTAAKRIAAGQGGLAGWHIPFTNTGGAIGTGAGSQALAEGLGSGLDAIKSSRPGLAARQLFDYRVQNQGTKLGQQMGEHMTDLLPEMTTQANTHILGAGKALDAVSPLYAKQFPTADPLTLQKILAHGAETGDMAGAFQHFGQAANPELLQAATDASGAWMKGKDVEFKKFLDKGGRSEFLDAEVSHFPRYADSKVLGTDGRVASPQFASMQARNEFLRDLPRETVNRMLQDKSARIGSPMERQLHLIRTYGIDPTKAGDVEKYILGTKAGKGNLFNNAPLADLASYHKGLAKASAATDAIHDLFGKTVFSKTAATQEAVSLADAFGKVGLQPDAAAAHFAKKFSVDLSSAYVPLESVQAARSLVESLSKPAWMENAMKSVNAMTDLFKKSVTLPFPSFHSRNFISGMYANLASGLVETPADAVAYAKSVWDARKNMRAGTQLADDAAIYGLAGKNLGISEIGVVNNTAQALTDVVPGSIKPWKSSAVDLTLSENPLLAKAQSSKIGGGIRKAGKKAMQSGENAAGQVEWVNRLGMFDYLVKKGWDKQAAANKVKELQFDYGQLTDMEKSMMKPLIPFYSFARKNIPLQFSNLFQRPGGLTAQTARLSNNLRDDSGYVPPHIGEGLAAKIGPDRFVSGLGLPIEQLGEMFAKGPDLTSTVQRTLQKGGAMLNPLVKTLIELATKTNLFTGRPISEMHPFPIPGRSNNAMNLAIGNSPLGRAGGVARTLMDTKWTGGPTVENGPRKELLPTGINLLTGGRITDVPGGLERQKELAVSKAIQERAGNSDNLGISQNPYLRRGKTPTLAEEEMLRVLTTLNKHRAEETKKKKREGR